MRNHCVVFLKKSGNQINERGRLQLVTETSVNIVRSIARRGLDSWNLPTAEPRYPSAGDQNEKTREIKDKTFHLEAKTFPGEGDGGVQPPSAPSFPTVFLTRPRKYHRGSRHTYLVQVRRCLLN